MDIEAILGDLKDQRDRIDTAISSLEGTGAGPRKRYHGKTGRHMSAEARARIGKAMRLRWAMRKGNKPGGALKPKATVEPWRRWTPERRERFKRTMAAKRRQEAHG